jgi:hypothetical protein
MSLAFTSKDSFSDEQIELMITDLRDILGRLKENSVLDFTKEKGIRLLDSGNTLIEFKVTEYTEVKRFIALVKSSFPMLTYLTRNPTSLTQIEEVERKDRIMGSINNQKTILVNRFNFSKDKIVVCNEIHKTMDSPENHVLADILFSIVLYCNMHISNSGYLKSGIRLGPLTIENINYIKNYATNLLSSNTMKKTLPQALSNISNFDVLFRDILTRVYLGKAPLYFAEILNLLHKWKYFVWVSTKEYNLVENTLRYHFFNLKRYDQLYECWIFYRILVLLTEHFNLKLKQTTRTKGTATFASDDDFIMVTYQRIYESEWKDKDGPIHDKPDIVIDFNDRKTIILDAKNSILSPGMKYPFRRQMADYITSAGKGRASIGIFIFSTGLEENWKEIKREDEDNSEQKIMWIGMSPRADSVTRLSNEKAMQKIIEIIKMHMK